jgi:A/G-specific adenine glycosylase
MADDFNLDTIPLETYQHRLLSWGKQNARRFPWRETVDPYSVLIAEIMLHRTQAIQVVPVYERFT